MVVLIALSIILGLAGLMVADWGICAIGNRNKLIAHFQNDPVRRRNVVFFWWIWTGLTLSSGLSMIAASALIWTRTALAIALAAFWPIAFLLYASIRKK